MSDQSHGPGWWQASDGKWYPPQPAQGTTYAGPRYAFKVLELRETVFTGKNSGAELERILNEWGAVGWEVKSIVKGSVSGRLGPGGVGGMLVTLQIRIA